MVWGGGGELIPLYILFPHNTTLFLRPLHCTLFSSYGLSLTKDDILRKTFFCVQTLPLKLMTSLYSCLARQIKCLMKNHSFFCRRLLCADRLQQCNPPPPLYLVSNFQSLAKYHPSYDTLFSIIIIIIIIIII